MASLRELIVKISADSTDFEKGIQRAQKQALAMSQKFEEAGRVLTTSLTLPLGALGALSLRSAAQFDSLTRGLTAVAGSSAAATVQLERLKKVAELPGLGFREAVQGSINLQAAGFSAQTAERALSAFGNALATVGKGRAELDGVVTALSQIQSKGKVSAEEINQLAERLPQIRVAMQAAFGTADTEAIQKLGISTQEFIGKIIAEFEKLPKVTGGFGNALENLKDRAEQSLAAIGKALIPFAEEALGALDPLTQKVGELGVKFSELPKGAQSTAVALGAIAIAAGPILSLIANFQKLGVVIGLAGAAIARSPLFLPGPQTVVIGLAGAIIYLLDALDRLDKRTDHRTVIVSPDNAKNLQNLTRLQNQFEAAASKANAVAIAGFGGLADKVFAVGANVAAVTAKAMDLRDAFKALNLKPMADVNADLAKAKEALSAIIQAQKEGKVSAQDVANAQAQYAKILEQSVPAIAKVKLAGDDLVTTYQRIQTADARIAEGNRISKWLQGLSDSADRFQALGDFVFGTVRTLEELGGGFRNSGEAATAAATELAKFSGSIQTLGDNAAIRQFGDELLLVKEKINDATGATGGLVDEIEKLRSKSDLQSIGIKVEVTTDQNEILNQIFTQPIKDAEILGQRQFPNVGKQASRMAREVDRSIRQISDGMADAIARGGSLGDAFRSLAQDISRSLISYAIQGGIKLLLNSLDGVISKLGAIGKAFSSVFGGAASAAGNVAGVASSTAGTVSGAASSAAGTAASVGLSTALGAVTAVSSVVSAVTGVLSYIQGRRMEQDIGRMEVTSRGILNQAISIQGSLNTWLPYLGGIQNALLNGVALGANTITGGGGNSFTFNFYGYAANPAQMAEGIVRELRLRSPAFA